MLYFLKFWAAFLLPPGIFLAAFFVVAVLLWRKNEKRFAGALLGINFCFYLLCTPLVADALLGSLEQRYSVPENVDGDVVIMLGGGATADTTDFQGMGNLGSSAGNRLLLAARIQRKLDIPILLSGGQVFSDSGREADIAKRQLLQLGVPEEKIIVENQSLNTKQNAQFSTRLLHEHGLLKPLLVTSAFHMERSVLNFTKAGTAVTPVPADYSVSKQQRFYFNRLAPSSGALQNSGIYFREWLGIWAARIVK